MKNLPKFLFVILMMLFTLGFMLQPEKNSEFKSEWKRVDDLVKQGLPKSALKIVDSIFLTAKETENTPQVLKSLIYRVSLQSQYKEEHLINAIGVFEEELNYASVPEKQLLQSLLAELYMWYYQQNRWMINDRTTLADPGDEDISTWDAVRLNKKIREYFLASLKEQSVLKDIPLANFASILNIDSGAQEAYTVWPTLYDLLCNRAIDYFSTDDAGLAKIGSDAFISAKFLVPVEEFLQMEINNADNNLTELMLYQSLLKVHVAQKNTAALLDLDLRRLKYVYAHLPQSEKNRENYAALLTRLSQNYRDYPEFTAVAYELASLYRQSGNLYDPLTGDEHRWDLNKADSVAGMAVKAFPHTETAKACQNLINDLNETGFSLTLDKVGLPDKKMLARLDFKNVSQLYFRIVKVNPDEFWQQSMRNTTKEKIERYLQNPAISEWKVDLPDTKDRQNHATEIIVPALGKGFYLLFISDSSSFDKSNNLDYNKLWISNLSYLTKSDRETGNFELFVLDREKGTPVPDVTVTTYRTVYQPRRREYTVEKLNTYQTNEEGYLKIEAQPDERNAFTFLLQKEEDELYAGKTQHVYFTMPDDQFRTKTYLFTDRAIYRPGQTVYFKGIVVDKKGNDVKVRSGYKQQIRLMNANYKEVGSVEKTTNDYGSFQGSFVIPQGGLNGRMTIKSESGMTSFQVEEYKRPTYRVAFDTITETYQLGDEIRVTGYAETYTGNAVAGAEVQYRVVQKMMQLPYYRYFYYYPQFAEKEIANGKLTSDANGRFTVTFPTEKETGNRFTPNYVFTVYADVTDLTGEVQSTETGVYAGPVSKVLTITSENKIHLETAKGIEVSVKNLSGAAIETETNLEVYKLTPPDHLMVTRNWNRPDLYLIPEEEYRRDFPDMVYKNENEKSTWQRRKIYEQPIQINGERSLLGDRLRTWDPGEYLIVVTDITDTIVKTEKYVTLYSTATKKIPVNDFLWSAITAKKAEPGDVVQLAIGSAGKKTRILYELVNVKEIVERKWLTANRGQKVLEIPVQDKYRGGFSIHLRTVKQNTTYSANYTVNVPFTNKKLDVVLETYRDDLTPGQKEEWKVKITGPGGDKVAAELLAGMYDASLDQFQANTWNLDLYHAKRNLPGWDAGLFRAAGSNTLRDNRPEQLEVKPIVYPAINWFGYRQGYGIGIYGGISGVILRKQGMAMEANEGMTVEDKEVVDQDSSSGEQATAPVTEQSNQPGEKKETLIPLRTNFNETAFFYPQLETDSSGNVVFSFTTPDALTEWKLMMLAHTKDLKTGAFVEQIKAAKDLMVIPNLPRFVRQGDQWVFKTKVFNYTDRQINPEVTLELFNPVTMKPVTAVDGKTSKSQTIVIEAGRSAVVQWKLDIPYDISLLGYRLKAVTSSFSDGEERMIPVLTNRMLVTETLPMHLNGNETKRFTIGKLANSDKLMRPVSWQNYRYTVEFTSNPAWYAIQALPYLSQPEVESAANLFHVYYANALSSFIVNSNPKIKYVFENWKTHTPDAFLSALQKNQELKQTVLDATPWVLEAENEAEQKRRIGILFDLNRISNQEAATLQKLRKNQLSNGAWPWFNGMREDRYTTQQIVLGFARLSAKQVISIKENQALLQMLRKAVLYLDEEINNDYERLKKNVPGKMDQNHLGSLQIQYLYARTLLTTDIQVENKYAEAYDYYLGQAKKYWLKQNNYLQAMMALTLNRTGYRNLAEGILRSLEERSIQHEEMGMYWRQEKGWRWYQAPVETQAMIIEAFNEITNKQALIDQMKIWLLKQKQTTRWNTSSATAEAVFALLMNGNDLLAGDQEVIVTVGKEKIDLQQEKLKTEAGTGYFKIAWTGSDIAPAMGNIDVTNPNSTIAWGAAYWQYFEQLDQITQASSPLTIQKKLFIEKQTENGPVLTEIKEGQLLKAGEKVVSRMIITTDRDMEYVQVNDMRSSAFEPVKNLSGYKYEGGLGYYENITDVSTDFFIRYLRKGTYVLEYPVVATQSGNFSNGIATIQSYYAPEFAAHSEGVRVSVE